MRLKNNCSGAKLRVAPKIPNKDLIKFKLRWLSVEVEVMRLIILCLQP